MDLIDKLKEVAQQIGKLQYSILSEEATKTAFIMPFMQSLGYNVFNPIEVIPEYTTDLPGLKGEKVDYAICIDNKPVILIECKHCQEKLEHPKHLSQLHRYFHSTEAKIGILTNGILYRFYTDINKDNVMDDKPFFEFNLLGFEDSSVNELKRFSKSNFNADELGDITKNLLYTKEIKRVIADELANPSPEFVKYFVGHVYSGVKTVSVVEKFTEITKYSLKEYINDKIKERLESAINKPVTDSPEIVTPMPDSTPEDDGIVTTPEELESFYIVKSVLRGTIDTSRLQYKDTKAYFGINIDGKVTKTICRLRFQENKKVVAVLDNEAKEAKHTISNLDELYGFSEFLIARVRFLTQDSYTVLPEQGKVI